MSKMNKNKGNKGEMSMAVIVAAVIALVIIIVLIAVFMGKIGDTSKSLSRCENRGGTCKSPCGNDESEAWGTDLCDAGDQCCVKIPGT